MDADQERAFSLFVRERGGDLLRYARRLIPNPDAYVRATLVNLMRDRGRRRHLVDQPAMLVEPRTAQSLDLAEAQAARAELDAALSRLPSRQRAAVVLRVIEGLTEAETAAVMGTSIGAAKSNLSRGLQKLRLVLFAPSPVWKELSHEQHPGRPQGGRRPAAGARARGGTRPPGAARPC